MSTVEQSTTNRPTAVAGILAHPSRATVVALTVVAGVLINLAVYALGAALGVSYEDPQGKVPASGAALITAVPLLVGMTIAALTAPRRPGVLRLGAVAGPALAVLTIGLTLAAEFDGPSTCALAAMHLTLIPVVLVGLGALRTSLARR